MIYRRGGPSAVGVLFNVHELIAAGSTCCGKVVLVAAPLVVVVAVGSTVKSLQFESKSASHPADDMGASLKVCSRKNQFLVSWCFKPSQPQRITSGLRKNQLLVVVAIV